MREPPAAAARLARALTCPRGQPAVRHYPRGYCFTCISFLTEVTPATPRATLVAMLMSELEFTKPLN
jgi:hypothetical protein